MLKIKFVVVDRTRSPFLKEGESLYLDRLKRYANTEWVEVKPVGIKKGRPPSKILEVEGNAISKKLSPRDYVVALDRLGQAQDSEGLAGRIEFFSRTHPSVTFVIGGPLGLSKDILSRSDDILSLSPLTLTHEMARLVLLEQLYRAFTIINNENYHK